MFFLTVKARVFKPIDHKNNFKLFEPLYMHEGEKKMLLGGGEMLP